MELKQWLVKNNQSQRSFSFKLGIHWRHLSHILKGTRHPSVKLAFKIEKLTNGEVSALELLKRKEESWEELYDKCDADGKL